MTMVKIKNCFVTAMLTVSVAMMCMTSCAKEDNPIDTVPNGVPEVTVASTNVTGTVLDQTGEPIIGATVIVKGSTLRTVTDFDGKFSIQASYGDTLVVSYIGYISEQVSVGTNYNITITLTDDNVVLDDVVVVG